MTARPYVPEYIQWVGSWRRRSRLLGVRVYTEPDLEHRGPGVCCAARRTTVVIPYRLLILPPALPPLAAALRAYRLREDLRRRAGRCLTCRYDLRATPHRCPECGRQVIPTASTGATP